MSSPEKVALVVGASRGIGRQIAIDLAKNDYRVVVAAKSTSASPSNFPTTHPDPNSPASTIHTVSAEISSFGGSALPLPVDVRSYDSIQELIDATLTHYGRIDVLIYNAGAIWWAPVRGTPMARFQLMQRVNPEGLYGCIQACLPVYEKQGGVGRIVVVCPPIYSRFFRGKTAYAMGKVGMSVLVKGLGMDFERQGLVTGKGKGKGEGMAVVGIWPATAVESAATTRMVRMNPEEARDLRKPTIFSDAVLAMLDSPPEVINGHLELDEDFLRKQCGITDFSKYSVVEGSSPRRIMPAQFPSLLVEEQDDEGKRVDSTKLGKAKL